MSAFTNVRAVRRLAPQSGTAFILERGARLSVIDPEGGQVSDLFCFSAADPNEWLSSGRTIDYASTIYLSRGDRLFSNRSRPMLTIAEDSCGRHDFSLTPCSQETFDLLYPDLERKQHPSCFENLCQAFALYGIEPDRISTTFNVFMNVWSEPDGALHIDPPRSVAGDTLVVEAEMDLIVGLTACAAEKSNGGVCKPIDYRIEPQSLFHPFAEREQD
jgi:uncharacterized protein YcgI (DUF1989 family)